MKEVPLGRALCEQRGLTLPSLPYPALTSHNSCCFSELAHALGKSVAVNDLLPATAAYDSQLCMNCYSQELNVES